LTFVAILVRSIEFFVFSFILESIQKHVVKHFGYSDVNSLRCAHARFPHDPILNNVYYSKIKKRKKKRQMTYLWICLFSKT